jgi:hypothetical protein
VHKGNVVDMFNGIPSYSKLEDFVNTGLLLGAMSTDRKILDQMLVSAKELRDDNNY